LTLKTEALTVSTPMTTSWEKRFSYAALVHIAGAAVWTGLAAIPDLNIPRIIAGGGSGTWYTVGYLMYILAGALGMLAFAALYRVSNGANGVLAWMHLVLSNVGVVGAAFLVGYAGYQAGYMQYVIPLATQGEPNIRAIHGFLSNFIEPIGVMVLVAVVGVLLGVVNLAIYMRRH